VLTWILLFNLFILLLGRRIGWKLWGFKDESNDLNFNDWISESCNLDYGIKITMCDVWITVTGGVTGLSETQDLIWFVCWHLDVGSSVLQSV